MDSLFHALRAALAVGLVVFLGSMAARGAAQLGPSRYDKVFAEAQARAGEGDLAQAQGLLESLIADYPEDYLLHLQLGFWAFEQGDYELAILRYRAASELSGGARDAELGLGFSLQRHQACDQARRHFEAVLTMSPQDEDALLGLRLCDAQDQPVVTAWLGAVGHAYDGHPDLAMALGGFVGLWLRPVPVLTASAQYRATDFFLRPVPRGRNARWSTVLQHDVFAHLGYAGEHVSLSGHFVHVNSSADVLAVANGGGVRASWALTDWATLLAEGSATVYSDLTAWRVQPAAYFVLHPQVGVRGSAAVQRVADTTYVAPELALYLEFDPVSLSAAGRLGQQRRPTSFAERTIYNTDDTVREGFWVGASVAASSAVRLSAVYEFQRRTSTSDEGAAVNAYAHFAALTLSYEN